MFHTITRYGILNIVSLFSLSVNNKERMNTMIEVTRLNGTQILVNAELIELVEETPDTVITFTTGRKIIVKESRQQIKSLVKSYKREIMETGFKAENEN